MRVAAEQLSKRELNGFGDGPGRNNKQFALFLPCYLPPFFLPLLLLSPILLPEPGEVLNKCHCCQRCAGAGSVVCQLLLTSEPTEFRYLPHTQSSGGFICQTVALYDGALL